MEPDTDNEVGCGGEVILSRISAVETLINEGIERVLIQFEGKLKYDAFKERQLDALHRELQEYKTDLLSQALRPMFTSLIRLHDDNAKMIEGLHAKNPEELTPERFFKVMEDFGDDIERLLQDHGVDVFQDQGPEQEFNGQRQQAAGFIDTTDVNMAGRVAQRLRPGFEYGKTLLRKERVKVYRRHVANDISANKACDEMEESR